MIAYLVFIVLRLLITVFFLLTSLYSILNYTPFVFNHFLRPRLFGPDPPEPEARRPSEYGQNVYQNPEQWMHELPD